METFLYVRLAGSEAIARVDPTVAPHPGDTVTLAANMQHAHLLDPDSGAVL
jgi:multiple sugar transport system ATP-binding protein